MSGKVVRHMEIGENPTKQNGAATFRAGGWMDATQAGSSIVLVVLYKQMIYTISCTVRTISERSTRGTKKKQKKVPAPRKKGPKVDRHIFI